MMGIKCHLCGEDTAKVRDCEIETAKITLRSHVDCSNGHSQYRRVSRKEIDNMTGNALGKRDGEK